MSTPTPTANRARSTSDDTIVLRVAPWFVAFLHELLSNEHIDMAIKRRDDDTYDLLLRRAQLA